MTKRTSHRGSRGRLGSSNDSELTGRRRALPNLVRLYVGIASAHADHDRVASRVAKTTTAAEELVVGVAYHEAGHAVVLRHIAGESPTLVTIERTSSLLEQPVWGFTRRTANVLHQPAEMVREQLRTSSANERRLLRMKAESEVVYFLAGEAVHAARWPENGGDDLVERLGEAWDDAAADDETDVGAARRLLQYFESDELRCWQWLVRLADRTDTIVRRPHIAAAISSVAEALLDKGTLEGHELVAVLKPVRTALQRQPRPPRPTGRPPTTRKPNRRGRHTGRGRPSPR